MSGIEENEQFSQLFSVDYVRGNHPFDFISFTLWHFGKAISGKIDDIPFFVDEKMIYESCLSGSGRCLAEVFVVD